MVKILLALVLVAACGGKKAPTNHGTPSPVSGEAVVGVTDPALRALLADHWEHTMSTSPEWATQLGDHRFDDQLARADAASLAAKRAATRDFLDRARAIDPAGLGAADQITRALLEGELASNVASDVCAFEQWAISAIDNPYHHLATVVETHPTGGADDEAHLRARMAQGARLIDETIANLEVGLGSGRVAAAEAVRRTVALLDEELARPVAAWGVSRPAHADLVDAELRPAVTRLRDFLRDRILPVARSGAAEGVGALPDGAACYQALILSHLGLPRTPDELHQLGLDEIARNDRELAKLGAKVLGTADLAATLDRLRTDRALYFDSGAAMMAATQTALDRARAAVPAWFGIQPRADCVLKEIPAHEAPYTTIAYYRGPNPDGSKPGEYFVNTYRPEVRPRFELEALTWHEAVPGHHLQTAIAMERGELPAFRKYGGSTAYTEGWALYTERLAEEMGLYSSDLDRIGMLSYDAWRASRLVVDTGLHARGWTRAQAEAFMLAHTALTAVNISNEVDRYIGWPGQALAYKAGQLEILALRAEAKQRLGARFDIKAFHDIVLGQGAVTLPVLRAQVERWIAGVE